MLCTGDTLGQHLWGGFKEGILNYSRSKSHLFKVSVKKSIQLEKSTKSVAIPKKKGLLNKRSEIIAKCRYYKKFLLANYKSKD